MSDPSSQPTQPLTDREWERLGELVAAGHFDNEYRAVKGLYEAVMRERAEVSRLRAENTALAERIDTAEKFARNWTEAPHEVTSQLDQYLQEDYGTTAIAHCGRAILTALGLDQDGAGNA